MSTFIFLKLINGKSHVNHCGKLTHKEAIEEGKRKRCAVYKSGKGKKCLRNRWILERGWKKKSSEN